MDETVLTPPPAAAAAQQSSSAAEPTDPPPPSSSATPASAAPKQNANASASANIEFEPPAACVRRLLKQALPKSTNVSKDSLAAICRASGIFVLYLTACANDVAREGRRTTIVAKDVLAALKELDFEDFVPLMEKFLEGHRRDERSKKEEKERVKKRQAERASREEEGGDVAEGRDVATGKFVAKDGKGEEAGEWVGEAPSPKKQRVDEGGDDGTEE